MNPDKIERGIGKVRVQSAGLCHHFPAQGRRQRSAQTTMGDGWGGHRWKDGARAAMCARRTDGHGGISGLLELGGQGGLVQRQPDRLGHEEHTLPGCRVPRQGWESAARDGQREREETWGEQSAIERREGERRRGNGRGGIMVFGSDRKGEREAARAGRVCLQCVCSECVCAVCVRAALMRTGTPSRAKTRPVSSEALDPEQTGQPEYHVDSTCAAPQQPED